MTEIISVRFKSGGKQYYFDPKGLTVTEGQHVIVETGKGLEYGVCTRPNSFVNDEAVVQPLRPVVRLANERDEKQIRDNRNQEKEAIRICQQLVERHKLDMKLVQVEYSFDGSKIIFFFTSEGRVDFRALVKDLAGVFRARIELRQIGVRDEARLLGGLGICGKPFCCSQFLNEFQPVSIKMAKTQSLSLNPTKISGTCGRLMCCLKYEQDAYEDAVKRCPKQESFVECPDGVGNVTAVNLLREQVKVRLEDSQEQPKTYHNSEIRVVRSGKGKRPENYTPPPREELEKLRYVDPNAGKRRFGEANELSVLLEQYLSANEGTDKEEKRQGGSRRRNKGGKQREERPARQENPSRQNSPKQSAQKQNAQKQNPSRQKAKAPAEQPREQKAQGEGQSQKRRHRHRPHSRKPKSGGEG